MRSGCEGLSRPQISRAPDGAPATAVRRLRFGSGPANASNSAAPVHLLAMVLIAVTLTLTALWLAVGLAIRVL